MYIEFGNAKPKNGIRTAVNPKDFSADELKEQAVQRGVTLQGSETKEQVAALLSAVVEFHDIPGPAVSRIEVPDDWTLMETIQSILATGRGFWDNHSNGPPDWVQSDNKAVAAFLSEHFGCGNGKPREVEATHYTVSGPPGVGPDGPVKKGDSK